MCEPAPGAVRLCCGRSRGWWTCWSSTSSPSATPGPPTTAVPTTRSSSSGSSSMKHTHRHITQEKEHERCGSIRNPSCLPLPLLRYSPLHNLPQSPYPGPPYPAVLLLTGDHDDRVVPLHTLKYCAALQHGVGRSPVQRQPLMVRVDTRSGHGAGKPTAKAILEETHVFSFIAETLGLGWKEWGGEHHGFTQWGRFFKAIMMFNL